MKSYSSEVADGNGFDQWPNKGEEIEPIQWPKAGKKDNFGNLGYIIEKFSTLERSSF